MLGLKSLFQFYINSSIHVSLAVVSLVIITFLNFDIPPDPLINCFTFLASITGYNFIKYAGIAKLHHLSLAKNLRVIQIISFIAFAALVYTLFFLPVSVLLVSGFLGILTVLYALPIFEGNNLRELRGVKIYIIAFVWAGVTVILPLLNNIELFQVDVLLTFIQRFCLIFALILPFEIRDLKFDMARLGTVPQLFGVKTTRKIGYFLIAGFVVLELKSNTGLANFISVLAVGVISLFLIKKATIRQKPYYSSFWVEGVPILWLLLLIFLRKIIY